MGEPRHRIATAVGSVAVGPECKVQATCTNGSRCWEVGRCLRSDGTPDEAAHARSQTIAAGATALRRPQSLQLPQPPFASEQAAADARRATAEAVLVAAGAIRASGPHVVTSGEHVKQVREAVAAWLAAGEDPWDLPACAVQTALSAHGLEANTIGTRAALLAVSDPCTDCGGDGSHVDDSHPANQAYPCERCDGHGRTPKRPKDQP